MRRSTIFLTGILLCLLFPSNARAQVSVDQKIDSLSYVFFDLIDGNDRQAESVGREILALAEVDSLDHNLVKRDILFKLYQLKKNDGDLKQAIDYHRGYMQTKDLIFQVYESRVRESFDQQYNAQMKEDEIRLLRTRNSVNSLQLRRRQIVLYSSLGLLIFVLVLLFFYLRKNRQIRKSIKEVATKNENMSSINKKLTYLNNRYIHSEEDLKRLNRTKDKFFSLISTELRNPLGDLSQLLNALIKNAGNFSKSEINTLAFKIQASVNSLLELIENLLQWSRIQMDKITINEEIVSINDIVDDNIDLLKTQADKKFVRFRPIHTSPAIVRGDRSTIEFVVRNLMFNALKFCHGSKDIDVRIESNDNQMTLSIGTDCDAFEVEQINKLWKSPVTDVTELMIRDENTSLGLLISRHFAGLNHGGIQLEKELEGAVFHLNLPVAA